MNHQITLEELGIILKQEEAQKDARHIDYAFPCGGCVCNHCANSVECWDTCAGEMEFSCFVCDECIHYDGRGKIQKRSECTNYKVTNEYAKSLRKRFKAVRPESEE